MNWVSTEIKDLEKLLADLKQDSKAKWGNMSAWHMIEHLGDMLGIALGDFPVKQIVPEEKTGGAQAFILSDKPLPRNFKAPYIKEEFTPKTESFEAAKERYLNQLTKFRSEFSDDSKQAMHPSFGTMNRKYWERLNQKHTHHHFMQFGLVEMEDA